jgi:hypothetical protein
VPRLITERAGSPDSRPSQRTSRPRLAYLVEVERFTAKVGASQEIASGALRVTSILRREGKEWKVGHRHADPITTVRPAESVVQ